MDELESKILAAVDAAPDGKLAWNDLIPLLGRNEDKIIMSTLRNMESKGTGFRVLELNEDTGESVLSIRRTKPAVSGGE